MYFFLKLMQQQAPAKTGLIETLEKILSKNTDWWFQLLLVLFVIGILIFLSLRIPTYWEKTKNIAEDDPVKKKRMIARKQFWTIWTISFVAVSCVTLVGLLVPALMTTIYAGIVISCIFIFEFRGKQHHDEQQVGFEEFKNETNTFLENYTKALKGINTKIENLETEVKSAKSNLSQSFAHYLDIEETPRNGMSGLTENIWKRANDLNRKFLPGGSEYLEERELKALFSIAIHKANDSFEQFNKNEIHCRLNAFKYLWPNLVECSAQYLSICDLSQFSNLDRRTAQSVSEDWEERVANEAKELVSFAKHDGLTQFDKIIVYEPRQIEESLADKPKCMEAKKTCCGTGECAYPCVVNSVVKTWKDKETDLVQQGVESISCHKGKLIWIVTKDALTTIGKTSSASRYKGRVGSLDLGIFGNNIIGEEYKMQEVLLSGWGEHDVRRTDITFSTPEYTFDYLYRFQVLPELIAKVRSDIKKSMNVTGGSFKSVN